MCVCVLSTSVYIGWRRRTKASRFGKRTWKPYDLVQHFYFVFWWLCRGDNGWVSGIPDCLFFLSTGAFCMISPRERKNPDRDGEEIICLKIACFLSLAVCGVVVECWLHNISHGATTCCWLSALRLETDGRRVLAICAARMKLQVHRFPVRHTGGLGWMNWLGLISGQLRRRWAERGR